MNGRSSRNSVQPPNEDQILSVFGRLKENIHEIKSAADPSRRSVDRDVDRSFSRSNSIRESGKEVRRSSKASVRPSDSISSQKPAEKTEKAQTNGDTDQRNHSRRQESTRSRNESYSSKVGHESVVSYSSRVSTRPKQLDLSRTSDVDGRRKRVDNEENSSVLDRSGRVKDGQNVSMSRRQRVDSRASERSNRSIRKPGLNPAEMTDLYLENYHREWMLYWNMQQQLTQRSQTPIQTPTHQFPPPSHPAYQRPPSVNSNINPPISSHPIQAISSASQPQPQKPIPSVHRPSFSNTNQSTASQSTPLQPPTASLSLSTHTAFQPVKIAQNPREIPKGPSRLPRVEFKGCLRSDSETVNVLRTGRASAIVAKSLEVAPHKYFGEMELFPGMFLWDDEKLRDSVVDFARHMSVMTAEDQELNPDAELQIMFWELVVHLVSRGENARPYEVAEILLRVAPSGGETGRNSVASMRSEMGRRERYPESSLAQIRKSLLVGDVEAAIRWAESGDCWDLAFLLQTATSNVETGNRQANELALKCLDSKVTPGDPVHTLASLACGRVPTADFCVRDWVSNLAVALSCSSFITSNELRLRFIRSLADILHDSGMPLERDICLIFCNSESRFASSQSFTLIGTDHIHNVHRTDNLSLPHFFMTEIFIYLAQILQGINLHANPAFIKLEIAYASLLIENRLIDSAVAYCRNIFMVVRDYGVPLGFEVYSQLFQVATSVVSPKRPEFYEEWFQGLWNIFMAYKNSKSPMSKPNEPIQQPVISQSEEFHVERSERPLSRASSVFDGHNGVQETYSFSLRRDSVSRHSSAGSRRESVSIAEDSHPVFEEVNRAPSISIPPPIPMFNAAGEDIRSGRSESVSIPPKPLDSVPVERKRSTSMPPVEPVQEPITPVEPVPMVPMFVSSSQPPRPSFFIPAPAAGPMPPMEPSSSGVELPSPNSMNDVLNTGQGNYYSGIDQADSPVSENKEDANEVKTMKIYDPFAEDQPLPGEKSGKKESGAPSGGANKENVKRNPGFFGSVFGTIGKAFKRPKQVHLPDDSKKTIYYDKEKKRWVNTEAKDDGQEAPPPPPPKVPLGMPMAAPSSNGGMNLNGGGGMMPPMSMQANSYRLGAGGSAGGNAYNPYATIMAGLKAPPVATTKPMMNHFVPAPTIPEE